MKVLKNDFRCERLIHELEVEEGIFVPRPQDRDVQELNKIVYYTQEAQERITQFKSAIVAYQKLYESPEKIDYDSYYQFGEISAVELNVSF